MESGAGSDTPQGDSPADAFLGGRELQIDNDPVANLTTCPACGDTISLRAPICPHCGHPVNATKTSATMVLVFGFLGIFLPVYGVVFGGLAWGFGNREIREIDAGLRVPSGRRKARVGRVLGIIGTLLWGAMLVVAVAAFAVGSPSQSNAGQLHLEGVEMLNDGRWEEARSTYTRIIDEFPPEDRNALGRAYLNRAMASFELGQIQDALADETVVIELAPSDVDLLARAYLNRSREHAYLGMRDEAVADATAVIDLQPNETDDVARAYVNRSISMREMGNPENALADLTAALNLNPEIDVRIGAFMFRSEIFGEQARHDEAIDDATAAIDASGMGTSELIDGTRTTRNELVGRAHLVRGVSCGTIGQSEAALEDLTVAIELLSGGDSRLASAHFARGLVFYDLYRDPEAVTDLEQVTILVPSSDERHQAAVELLAEIGETI